MQISLKQSYWTVCSTTQNFLPDSQLANKQYLLFLFGVGWKHKGIHWGVAVLQYCVVQTLQCCANIAATVWRHAWRAVRPLHSVVPTLWGLHCEMDLFVYCTIIIMIIINNINKSIKSEICWQIWIYKCRF